MPGLADRKSGFVIWQVSPVALFASSRQGNEEIYRLGSAERTACTMSAVVLHSMPIGDRASQMVLAIAAGGATASENGANGSSTHCAVGGAAQDHSRRRAGVLGVLDHDDPVDEHRRPRAGRVLVRVGVGRAVFEICRGEECG